MSNIDTYKNIKLSKKFYEHKSKSFTQILEELDPDDIYVDSPLRALDAYERQLRRFDIKVKGSNTDSLKKFFETTETALLFPEFINRKINRGYKSNAVLSHIVSSEYYLYDNEYDNIIDYKLTKSDTNTYELKHNLYNEIKPLLINLNVSYDSIKDMNLDSFGIILNSMGNVLAYDAFNYCIERLTNFMCIMPSDIVHIKNINYKTILSIGNLSYGIDTFICDTSTLIKILSLPELETYISIDSNRPGIYNTNIGITIIGCNNLKNEIIALNSNTAINAIYGSKGKLNWETLMNTDFNKIEYILDIGFSKIIDKSVIRCFIKK